MCGGPCGRPPCRRACSRGTPPLRGTPYAAPRRPGCRAARYSHAAGSARRAVLGAGWVQRGLPPVQAGTRLHTQTLRGWVRRRVRSCAPQAGPLWGRCGAAGASTGARSRQPHPVPPTCPARACGACRPTVGQAAMGCWAACCTLARHALHPPLLTTPPPPQHSPCHDAPASCALVPTSTPRAGHAARAARVSSTGCAAGHSGAQLQRGPTGWHQPAKRAAVPSCAPIAAHPGPRHWAPGCAPAAGPARVVGRTVCQLRGCRRDGKAPLG